MIIKLLFLTLFVLCSTYAKEFKVASYNVENLFDLHTNATEYKEYIPNKQSQWNQQTYVKKLHNIAKVLNDLDAHIVALQEVESNVALKDLLKLTPKYKYSSFVKNRQSAIGVAILSKFEILKTKQINIKSSKKYTRPIQEVTLKIGQNVLKVFNNHWPSKRAAENERVEYALTLQKYLEEQNPTDDYILLGDFNSNYNEFQTYKNDKKLNNTYGNTGINQVLNTTINKKYITKDNILTYDKKVHYNLWFEQEYQNRFSYKYKSQNNTPDNILLNPALFDAHKISYVNQSFKVFKPSYLVKNNKIQRWKTQGKHRVHLGVGFSDHLPIYALFSTNKKFKKIKVSQKSVFKISNLYESLDLKQETKLYNVIVIYKDKSNAIIKQKDNRAIYIYREAKNLELGKTYDFKVTQIKTYNGLKEIVGIDDVSFKNHFSNYKNLYVDANTVNILDYKYQNEIITNLKATYKKGYLYYQYKNQNQKIKLYSKEKLLLPKNGQNITIISGHLGFYKSKPQIIIYKASDIVN